MSYILDALKKAEQEREQGAVPGLHAQQVLPGDANPNQRGLSPLTWAGIGMALTLAGVLTWRNWPQPPVPATEAARTVRMAEPQVQSPVTTPSPARVAAKVPASHNEPRPPAAGSVAMQVEGDPPPGTSRPWPAQPALSVPGGRGSEKAADQGRPRVQDAHAAGASPLPLLADLPEALRKEMPVLSVGGAMHSPVPSQRMIVLNGQVMHEGDSPQAGLQLEEIRLKSAVLNFRGQRFELPF